MHSVDYSVARCLSVCMSLASILSTLLKISSNFLSSGSPTILVFPCQTLRQYSDGDLLTEASDAIGYEKVAIFDPISHFISEMMQVRANRANMKRYTSFRMVPFLMTLSDP